MFIFLPAVWNGANNSFPTDTCSWTKIRTEADIQTTGLDNSPQIRNSSLLWPWSWCLGCFSPFLISPEIVRERLYYFFDHMISNHCQYRRKNRWETIVIKSEEHFWPMHILTTWKKNCFMPHLSQTPKFAWVLLFFYDMSMICLYCMDSCWIMLFRKRYDLAHKNLHKKFVLVLLFLQHCWCR